MDYADHEALYTKALAELAAVELMPGGVATKKDISDYWKTGAGAARIRWGTPGDFTRCEAAFDGKVSAGSAKRMCAQWHHDMTGTWPGSNANVGKR